MSFVRLDDRIAFHPKVIAAGDEAIGLWVRMIAYACAHYTDGFISDEQLRNFPAKKATVERLLRARLLDRVRGGVTIHDFHDWNQSSEQQRARQAELVEKRRRAGHVGGRKSAEARKNKASASSNEANGQANGKQSASGQTRFASNSPPSTPKQTAKQTPKQTAHGSDTANGGAVDVVHNDSKHLSQANGQANSKQSASPFACQATNPDPIRTGSPLSPPMGGAGPSDPAENPPVVRKPIPKLQRPRF